MTDRKRKRVRGKIEDDRQIPLTQKKKKEMARVKDRHTRTQTPHTE